MRLPLSGPSSPQPHNVTLPQPPQTIPHDVADGILSIGVDVVESRSSCGSIGSVRRNWDRRKIKKVDGPGRQYLDLFVKMIDWLEVQEAAARQLDEVRKAGPGSGGASAGIEG